MQILRNFKKKLQSYTSSLDVFHKLYYNSGTIETSVKNNDFPLGFMDPDKIEMALRHVGFLEQYKRKELKCSTCDHIVTKKNLRVVYKKDGKPYVGCAEDECYREAIRILKS